MWFMKYIANPLVIFILRSPFHAWFSETVLLITVFGRKTGRPYTLPVNYAQSGNNLWVIPGMIEQKTWWRNVRDGAEVNIILRGKQQKAFAEVVSGQKDCQAVAEALTTYFHRFPQSARMRQVHADPGGTYRAEHIRKLAVTTTLVRVQLRETV